MSPTITGVMSVKGLVGPVHNDRKISEENVRTFDAREEDGMRAWVKDQMAELRLKILDRKKERERVTSRWQYQVRPAKNEKGRWVWQVWLVEYDATDTDGEAGNVSVKW
jgi:hypothetical protein